jgi:hypothetical protein
MSTRQERITAGKSKISCGIDYGVGGSAFAELPREQVVGRSALEIIKRVIGHPQLSDTASRTAKVIEEALRTKRMIDAELTRAARNKADGEPIRLDQVLVESEEGEEQDESVVVRETDEITIRLSEAYRGGDARCQCRRRTEEV